MKIKNFYVSCENKNIINHIYIFIFSQKNRFQMTLKYKICENKNHVKIKYLDLVKFVKIKFYVKIKIFVKI